MSAWRVISHGKVSTSFAFGSDETSSFVPSANRSLWYVTASLAPRAAHARAIPHARLRLFAIPRISPRLPSSIVPPRLRRRILAPRTSALRPSFGSGAAALLLLLSSTTTPRRFVHLPEFQPDAPGSSGPRREAGHWVRRTHARRSNAGPVDPGASG